MSKIINLNYKSEIDSLRFFAVLLVIFFHFDLFGFSGGYIGVDIFFVISGYLITSLVTKNYQKKLFLFEFFIRRLRRIIPALYFLILVVVILSYIILSPEHFLRVTNSAKSSILAYSNFFFWSELSYFDFESHFKPFLHSWSLSVEIQFYLIWSIVSLLCLIYLRKYYIVFILLTFLITLFLSTIYSSRSSGFFYFTFFRFYEFSLGALVFLLKEKIKFKNNDLFFFIGILIILLSSLFFDEDSFFPGFVALIPCLGASLIILSGGNLKFFKKIFINNLFIFLGKISYSLYLVHWPVLIFYKYTKLQPITFNEKIILLILTVLISIISFYFVEKPFRKKKNNAYLISNKNLIYSFLSSIIIIYFLTNYLGNQNKFEKLSDFKQKVLNKLEVKKDYLKNKENLAEERIIDKIYFENKNKKNVLIWGDSHALDLYGSLVASADFKSVNFEFLNYDYFYCFKKKNFKDKIVKFIKDNLFSLHNCEDKINNFHLGYEILKYADVIIISSRWTKDIDFNLINKFSKKFSSSKIIIFGRKPRFFHIPTLFIKTSEDLNNLAFLNRDPETQLINDLIIKDLDKDNFSYFNFENLVCFSNQCTVLVEDKLLISDEDHWSYQGILYYGKLLKDNYFLEFIINKSN
jgi:peptidoglycan/LPS O-acetylase OafA/YrhL